MPNQTKPISTHFVSLNCFTRRTPYRTTNALLSIECTLGQPIEKQKKRESVDILSMEKIGPEVRIGPFRVEISNTQAAAAAAAGLISIAKVQQNKMKLKSQIDGLF